MAIFSDAAREIYRRGLAPFGARRAAQLCASEPGSAFSPALEFLFFRRLSPSDNRVVARVEALRATLARRAETFQVMTASGTFAPRTAQRIAFRSSVTQEWGTVLYLLAKGFGADTILELGSCAGISGSYLASAPQCRVFISIEKSPALAALAETHVRSIFPRAYVLNAGADEILNDALARFENALSLYYIDANHTCTATLNYFHAAVPHLKRGALVIFDDIHWSKEMWRAWRALRVQQGFAQTLDLGRFGLGVWQGGKIQPRTYTLAKYLGWLREYAEN